MKFFIAGGGCFGTYYLEQLIKGEARGVFVCDEIVVIDNNPACKAIRTIQGYPRAKLELVDWIEFGTEVFQSPKRFENAQWIPAPLSPHLICEWLINYWRSNLNLEFQVDMTKRNLAQIAYADQLQKGTFVYSHAPGRCPSTCAEPLLCPLIKGDRDWEMVETLRKHYSGNHLGLFRCQHFGHGVGTIGFDALYRESERLSGLIQKGAKDVGVATISSCHGIVDFLKVV